MVPKKIFSKVVPLLRALVCPLVNVGKRESVFHCFHCFQLSSLNSISISHLIHCDCALFKSCTSFFCFVEMLICLQCFFSNFVRFRKCSQEQDCTGLHLAGCIATQGVALHLACCSQNPTILTIVRHANPELALAPLPLTNNRVQTEHSDQLYFAKVSSK